MTKSIFALFFLALAVPAAAQRQPLGVYSRWGAFEENDPRRCLALAEPVRSLKPRDWKPYAAVTFDSRSRQGQIYFRLSRMKREGSAVLLKIDGRPFQLMAGGADAWAPDPRADAEIAAAMRLGVDMVVETRSDRGVWVRDHYQLRGAATAMDAAALACAKAG